MVFAAKFKRDVPGLFSVHCIAHREALAASDGFKKINQLDFSERLANGVYGWVVCLHFEIENCNVC